MYQHCHGERSFGLLPELVGLRLWGRRDRDLILAEDGARFEAGLYGWRVDELDVVRSVGGRASAAFGDLSRRHVLRRLSFYDRVALIVEQPQVVASAGGGAVVCGRVSR